MGILISDLPEETILSIRIANARRDAEDLYELLRRVAEAAGFEGEFYALAAAQRRIAQRLIEMEGSNDHDTHSN